MMTSKSRRLTHKRFIQHTPDELRRMMLMVQDQRLADLEEQHNQLYLQALVKGYAMARIAGGEALRNLVDAQGNRVELTPRTVHTITHLPFPDTEWIESHRDAILARAAAMPVRFVKGDES